MNAVVAEHFADMLNPLLEQKKTLSIKDLANSQGYVNDNLLIELLRILESEGYIRIIQDNIQVLKRIPKDHIDEVEKKLAKEVKESFHSFVPTIKKALGDRLKGIPISEFDAGELRVQWEIALKGDFYTLQRSKALNFARIPDFTKNRAPPIRILDYGCGSGEGTRQLYDFFKKNCNMDFTLDGCDVSIGLLEIAEDDVALDYPLEFFSLKDTNPKKNYYDAIFLSQVIHWPEDTYKLIKELKESLKPGGMLFGVESNLSSRIYQIDLFLRLLGSQGFPKIELLYDWFESNGLKLIYDEVFYSFKAIKPS